MLAGVAVTAIPPRQRHAAIISSLCGHLAEFESIREDLGNSYTVTYYPQANENEGFRKIKVEIVGDTAKKYRVFARPGYRPRGGF